MLISSRRGINISNDAGCTLLAQSAQFQKGIRVHFFYLSRNKDATCPKKTLRWMDSVARSFLVLAGRRSKRLWWQCCSRAAGFFCTADGDWEGCPDSELPPFADSRILDGAGARNPQRSGPPRRPKLLAHPATSRPHLGLILLGTGVPTVALHSLPRARSSA